MLNPQCTSTPIESIPYSSPSPCNPFTTIKAINRSELTKGAKVLYSQLRVSAGPKGFMFYRVYRLAEDTKSSISSTKEYLQELRSAGLVIPEHRPGRSNKWHVFDPDPNWDGKVPEPVDLPPTQPEDQRGGSRNSGGGAAGASAPLKNVDLKNVQKKRSTLLSQNPVENTQRCDVPDPHPAVPESSERPPKPTSTMNSNVTSNVIYRCAQETATRQQPRDNFEPEAEPQTQPESEDHQTLDSQPKTKRVPLETNSSHLPTGRCDSLGEGDITHGQDSTPPNLGGGTTIFDTNLLKEVLTLTGDHKNQRCWIYYINRIPEEEIRIAMSSLRIAMTETIIDRPGGYMMGVIKRRNPELPLGKRKGTSQPTKSLNNFQPKTETSQFSGNLPSYQTPKAQAVPEEESEPITLDDQILACRSILKIRQIEDSFGIMQNCIGEGILDMRTLWAEINSLFPNHHKKDRIERFFETVTIRLKHHEKMTENPVTTKPTGSVA